ncbi:MAG: lipoyl(octanoyl) transferase LipB [Pseudomonadota bacterium]
MQNTTSTPDQPSTARAGLVNGFLAAPGSPLVEWRVHDGLLDYKAAVREMEDHVRAVAKGEAAERIWLVEHPSLYTAGTSAKAEDLTDPKRFPVFETGRGGQYTYHGPGQRVVYVMLDLKRRKQDVRAFVAALEHWIIETLSSFGVVGERREDRVGVWVRQPTRPLVNGVEAEAKIAAIGIRLKSWVSFHGLSINVEPQLDHFDGIVPCGVQHHGVTSLVDLGLPVSMNDLDLELKAHFTAIFGPVSEQR